MISLSSLLQGGQGGGYGQEHGAGYESGPEGLGSIGEIPDYIVAQWVGKHMLEYHPAEEAASAEE